MKTYFVFMTAAFIAAVGATSVQAQNYKIKQSTSMSGMSSTSTVYVKGQRKRTEDSGYMGMGGDITDVEQCDLKRYLKISDKKKLYYIEPFATPTATATKPVPKAPVQKATKGGTVTINSVITDTGERKQMFGLMARRVKTSMSMTSSPDACSKADMKIETDGWYVDLPGFACPMPTVSRQYYEQQPQMGCRDETITKSSGSGKTGFALEQTQTMTSSGSSFVTTTSTLEFSRAALADSLFDIPAGYAQAKSADELNSTPDYSAMMGGRDRGTDVGPLGQPSAQSVLSPKTPGVKKPGMIRVGVMLPGNRGDSISLPAVQRHMAQQLTSGNVEGIAVTTEAEARTLNCDYIVTSEFSKLKQSTASKFGGVFGAVTGTDTGSPKYEAQVDFKVVKLADGKSVLQKKASSKTETDAQRAAENVIAAAAAMVMPVTK